MNRKYKTLIGEDEVSVWYDRPFKEIEIQLIMNESTGTEILEDDLTEDQSINLTVELEQDHVDYESGCADAKYDEWKDERRFG